MPVPDPETDPAILALERNEAYATAAYHEEMRKQAEKAEEEQILRRRLLVPKAYAFTYCEAQIARHRLVPEDPEELIAKLERKIRQANEEIASLAPEGSRSRRIIEAGLDTWCTDTGITSR